MMNSLVIFACALCILVNPVTSLEGGSSDCDPACTALEMCLAGRCVPTGAVEAIVAASTPSGCNPGCASRGVCLMGRCFASSAAAAVLPGPYECDPACSETELCLAGQCVASGICSNPAEIASVGWACVTAPNSPPLGEVAWGAVTFGASDLEPLDPKTILKATLSINEWGLGFYDKENQAAGTRIRKGMQDLKFSPIHEPTQTKGANPLYESVQQEANNPLYQGAVQFSPPGAGGVIRMPFATVFSSRAPISMELKILDRGEAGDNVGLLLQRAEFNFDTLSSGGLETYAIPFINNRHDSAVTVSNIRVGCATRQSTDLERWLLRKILDRGEAGDNVGLRRMNKVDMVDDAELLELAVASPPPDPTAWEEEENLIPALSPWGECGGDVQVALALASGGAAVLDGGALRVQLAPEQELAGQLHVELGAEVQETFVRVEAADGEGQVSHVVIRVAKRTTEAMANRAMLCCIKSVRLRVKLERLMANALGEWTDHNEHDPGMALQEVRKLIAAASAAECDVTSEEQGCLERAIRWAMDLARLMAVGYLAAELKTSEEKEAEEVGAEEAKARRRGRLASLLASADLMRAKGECEAAVAALDKAVQRVRTRRESLRSGPPPTSQLVGIARSYVSELDWD